MAYIVIRCTKVLTKFAQHGADCMVEGDVSIAQIHKLSKTTCLLCGFFYEALLHSAPSYILDCSEDHNLVWTPPNQNNTATIHFYSKGQHSQSIQFFGRNLPLDLLTGGFDSAITEPPSGTASQLSLKKAMAWLEACTSTHRLCGLGLAQPLPSRILDVSCSKVRLLETNGETARYVCLSHCWGRRSVLKTTMANIKDFGEGIPWDLLPKTFQDAIEFTRRIGLTRIWIDSLCIIQDDTSVPSDWELQAASMSSIYENSHVTLAATRSADATEGCFTTPKDYVQEPYQVKSASALLGSEIKIFTRSTYPHVAWAYYHDRFPLLQRAWAYQERTLAPRTIHFAGRELQWECRHMSSCECSIMNHGDLEELDGPWKMRLEVDKILLAWHTKFMPPTINDAQGTEDEAPLGSPLLISQNLDSYMEDRAPRVTDSISKQYTQITNDDTIVSILAPVTWRRMTQRYSALKLTFPSDILPAFSGLARSWNQRSKDMYLAGLWKQTLLHDLMWYTNEPRPRPAKWRAPSWSWASLDSQDNVKYYKHDSLDAKAHVANYVADGAEVLDARCVTTGPDPTGEISHGYICLSCRALPASIFHWDRLAPDQPTNGDFQSFRLIINDICWDDVSFKPDTVFWEEDSGNFMPKGSSVYILSLCVKTWNATDTYMESMATTPIADQPMGCLVVRQKLLSEPSERLNDMTDIELYERVGAIFLSPMMMSEEVLIPRHQLDLDINPWRWPQPKVTSEESRQSESGLIFEPWRYDAYCRLARKMASAPKRPFKIV